MPVERKYCFRCLRYNLGPKTSHHIISVTVPVHSSLTAMASTSNRPASESIIKIPQDTGQEIEDLLRQTAVVVRPEFDMRLSTNEVQPLFLICESILDVD